MADYFGMKMVLYSLLLPKGVYSRESLNFDGTKFRYHLKLPKSQITDSSFSSTGLRQTSA